MDAISLNEGVDRISVLEGLPDLEVESQLSRKSCVNHNEQKLYFIHNSFESSVSEIEWTDAQANFENEYIRGYVTPNIQLMRLFKEGNICMPSRYYYTKDGETIKPFLIMGTELEISNWPEYTLEDSEILGLDEFIHNTKLPFTESFLQLAFENFELSYQTSSTNLAFLSLMISLETLFNPGEHELTYRISRNAAVLLGKDRDDSKTIFSEMKALYAKRSKIVHSGETNIVTREDVLKLRNYVRESIKETNKIGMKKPELLDMLNSCGFGERTWTT